MARGLVRRVHVVGRGGVHVGHLADDGRSVHRSDHVECFVDVLRVLEHVEHVEHVQHVAHQHRCIGAVDHRVDGASAASSHRRHGVARWRFG
jgi:hypothetical protein